MSCITERKYTHLLWIVIGQVQVFSVRELEIGLFDLTFSGNVYVSWTHFVGNSDSIALSRSADHGRTWSPMLRIRPLEQDGAVQGSAVAVGPNGEAYVVYEGFLVGGQRQHLLAKSVDGGASFSTPVAITPLFNELSFGSTYRKNSFAARAVAPDGTIYAVYADQPNPTVGAEVEFIRSTTPGGITFTAPLVINDNSAGQQFFPALTVDGAGVIHASWFDTRNNPPQTSLYDIFATFSPNGGASFTPNARLTSITVDAGNASFIGYYAGRPRFCAPRVDEWRIEQRAASDGGITNSIGLPPCDVTNQALSWLRCFPSAASESFVPR